MNFTEGQGILGRITFKDGTRPEYDRPYLIVAVSADYLELLNISSVKGKEWKLSLPANAEIVNYNPPFLKPSFVKLDSLTRVYADKWHNLKLLADGAVLDRVELEKIRRLLKTI
ncbi:MAG: hypothetical protein Q4E34_03125 [Synergistaceae bacterium]|nr:hypothetical protein [Synergistaceae bacterium]